MSNGVKFLIGTVVLIMVGMFSLRVYLVTNMLKEGKHFYSIKVNSYRSSETYITKEYERDKMTGCITFKDEFGMTQVVCNGYTITEF